MLLSIVLTAIFYVLLLGMLVFIGLIWHEAVKRRTAVDSVLLDAVQASAQAAKASAEAACLIAEQMAHSGAGAPPHA